eukprot:CAMPEP_0203850212 /NCGR_PEP_ID=MMETSP0359-20131031/6645_1 /ASSEMBLY_ACC=CAM_ASM_000338 /TAXON_ID=268821 /ORGANISM="Scrippsiella Hangoei, Strain SHTV-5" /LENGTH=43 /DNA_ID= /DNA_START= /DNA_END= /DNA_ORIENTATION=
MTGERRGTVQQRLTGTEDIEQPAYTAGMHASRESAAPSRNLRR